MAVETALRDGTPAVVWPLLPGDREVLRAVWDRMSPESRFRRFFVDLPELGEDLLHLLVDTVDGVDHVAFVLIALPVDGPEEVAGIGRVVRDPDRPCVADIGVGVPDQWQGRGVATALLAELVAGRPAGIHRLATHVIADNAASMAMLARLGELVVTGADGSVQDVEIDLRKQRAHAAA